MQEKLAALAVQIEAITRRLRTLGLSRTAEDLVRVSSELRLLCGEASGHPAEDDEGGPRSPETPGPAT